MEIKRMKEELKEYNALLEAWENVEVVTKKDGKPFKTLKRNFRNCTFMTRYSLETISVSMVRNNRIYHDDLIIYKNNDVEAIKSQINSRIETLKKSVETWKKSIDIIENNTVDVDQLAKSIMDNIKEKCNDNVTATSIYKFKLMEKLKENY